MCFLPHVSIILHLFYRKKKSSYTKKQDWKAAANYVAKKYMQNVERDVYFADVKLQMDAKLWGEEYNRHNPPKKVGIACMKLSYQMTVLQI